MKRITILIMFFSITMIAQRGTISNLSLGVNYMKSEIIGADLKLYNIHFEKQSTGNITFGGEINFKAGTIKSGTQFNTREIKSLYFGGPSILYTNAVFGMLHYKITLNANLGYIHYEQYDFDIVQIDKSLYYGFGSRLEGMALLSQNMQFVIGLGFIKGFTQSGGVELETNTFYHIGLAYLF